MGTRRKRQIWGVLLLFVLPACRLFAQYENIEEIRKTFQARTDKPLEIWLDVDAAEVVVEKGQESRSAGLLIQYTFGDFRERIDFDESKNRIKIELDKKNWRSHHRRDEETDRKSDEDRFEKEKDKKDDTGVAEDDAFNEEGDEEDRDTEYSDDDWNGKDNWALVELTLPTDVDICMDARIKAGEITMAMGGLRLKEFFLNNWAGDVEVRFDEPNRIPADVLDIDAKVGEVRLVHLGNALFKKAHINGGIGSLMVDFSGELLHESQALVDIEIGEATVSLPENVGIQMKIGGSLSFLCHKDISQSLYKRGSTYYSDDYKDEKKKFYVRISPGLGELRVEKD